MPRKQKDVYERINLTEERITALEFEIKKQKEKLGVLYTERDNLEMYEMFKHARENNMSFDDVIRAMSVYTAKQQITKRHVTETK